MTDRTHYKFNTQQPKKTGMLKTCKNRFAELKELLEEKTTAEHWNLLVRDARKDTCVNNVGRRVTQQK